MVSVKYAHSKLIMPSMADIDRSAQLALQEDKGDGDLTTNLLSAGLHSTAYIISHEDAVLCGTAWFESIFRQLDTAVAINWHVSDGNHIHKDQQFCTLVGPTRAILTGERPAINFLQTLSATATITRQYVEVLIGTATQLLDTRKTIPGLRSAQKYAVRCGGGTNHRLGLFDGILLKENHITAFGSIHVAVETARQKHCQMLIEIEVETLQQVEQAIDANVDIILLDNFSLQNIQVAVGMTNGRAKLEVSGGLDVTKLAAIAGTGVDYISVGALTKHIRAVDLSMRFVD